MAGAAAAAEKIFQNAVEWGLPAAQNFFRKKTTKTEKALKRWEADYLLNESKSLYLVDDYLEMVIQFGFVSMFAAGFMLAPVLSLANNIIEIRLDANKMLKQFRRPIPSRVTDLGAWYDILVAIVKIGIVTNACIIAFTSDYLDRLAYKMEHGKGLEGYLESAMSVFNVSDWPEAAELNLTWQEGRQYQTCIYRDYRYPPGTDREYQRTTTWWRLLAVKLAFLLIFFLAIFLLQVALEIMVPDVPEKVQIAEGRARYNDKMNRGRMAAPSTMESLLEQGKKLESRVQAIEV